MATTYGPVSPTGANEGDRWINSTTQETRFWANNTWNPEAPIETGGSNPTLAAGAGAGTSPPTPTVDSGANAIRGQVSWGTGTSPATGAQVAVTFATPRTTSPYVFLTSDNAVTEALNLFVTAASTTGFTISAGVAPAASQGATVYVVHYLAEG